LPRLALDVADDLAVSEQKELTLIPRQDGCFLGCSPY
jgi:hypothetical protein